MPQREMPPEIKQGFDRLHDLLADPDATDAEFDAAFADLERTAGEKDPEFAAWSAPQIQQIRRGLKAGNN
jgi:hypothetical protein